MTGLGFGMVAVVAIVGALVVRRQMGGELDDETRRRKRFAFVVLSLSVLACLCLVVLQVLKTIGEVALS